MPRFLAVVCLLLVGVLPCSVVALGLGEIDLIASLDDYLVFVEVKTRTAGHSIHPAEAVTPKKRAKVRQVGEYYVSNHPRITRQPRFDVISVVMDGGQETVEHIPDAF